MCTGKLYIRPYVCIYYVVCVYIIFIHIHTHTFSFILLNRLVLKLAGRLEESRHILDNNPASGLAAAVAKAWELYGSDR